MEPAVFEQPFNRDDLASIAFEAEEEARQGRRAVDEDGAGAALAELAPMLRAGQIQVLPEDLEERLVGVERGFGSLAVDHERDHSEASW
jgi:tripartite-type tricarboxylate transporter receptor subunit TctC